MKIKLFIIFSFTWQTVFPQILQNVAEDYFRTNPFKTTFSQFLNNLINDPAISEKSISKKTDSTLYYFQGVYNSHSPFFFPSSHCKVILAEQEEYSDSLTNNIYTYFIYQLISYATPGEEGIKHIKQEFEKLNRRFKNKFEAKNQKDIKRGNEQSGAIIDYTSKGMIFHPLTIAWASSIDRKENILVLSIRFFIYDNKAYLPIPSDSP
jgi:hypothetical protein